MHNKIILMLNRKEIEMIEMDVRIHLCRLVDYLQIYLFVQLNHIDYKIFFPNDSNVEQDHLK